MLLRGPKRLLDTKFYEEPEFVNQKKLRKRYQGEKRENIRMSNGNDNSLQSQHFAIVNDVFPFFTLITFSYLLLVVKFEFLVKFWVYEHLLGPLESTYERI